MKKRKKYNIRERVKQDTLFQFRLNNDLKQDLFLLSSAMNVKTSQLIRDAVLKYVKQNKASIPVRITDVNQLKMFQNDK
jgi:antitoxin component of RelBE/YafQ-DinJ toxin-antitoxin module